MTNKNKPVLRKLKQSCIVAFEGKTEESFFKILKSLFWNKINCGIAFNEKAPFAGGSSIAQLNQIRKFDIQGINKVLWITDKDRFDEKDKNNETAEIWLSKNAKLNKILTIILFTPCIEGVILEIHNRKFNYEIIDKQSLKNKCNEICENYCKEEKMKMIITPDLIENYLNYKNKNSRRNYEQFSNLYQLITSLANN